MASSIVVYFCTQLNGFIIGIYCLYIAKWLQISLLIVCAQLNDFYVMLFIVCTQLNGFKYCYLLLAHRSMALSIYVYCLHTVRMTLCFDVYCLHTVKWLQVLLPNTSSFICAQQNSFKYCYVTLIVLYLLDYSHYQPHLHYAYNVLVDISFGRLQMFHVEPRTEPFISSIKLDRFNSVKHGRLPVLSYSKVIKVGDVNRW